MFDDAFDWSGLVVAKSTIYRWSIKEFTQLPRSLLNFISVEKRVIKFGEVLNVFVTEQVLDWPWVEGQNWNKISEVELKSWLEK